MRHDRLECRIRFIVKSRLESVLPECTHVFIPCRNARSFFIVVRCDLGVNVTLRCIEASSQMKRYTGW